MQVFQQLPAGKQNFIHPHAAVVFLFHKFDLRKKSVSASTTKTMLIPDNGILSAYKRGALAILGDRF